MITAILVVIAFIAGLRIGKWVYEDGPRPPS
jgi:hypothetical protein